MTITRSRTAVSRLIRPVPAAPILLVARDADDDCLSSLRRACGAEGWRYRVHIGDDRLAWTASVHRPPAIMVVASGSDWTAGVTTAIRSSASCPVVVVGDLPSEFVLRLLKLGVDLIVSAELPDEETLARTYAVIRRSVGNGGPEIRYLTCEDLRLDLWQRTVSQHGAPVHLTPTEFDLLSHLMRHSQAGVGASATLRQVWGDRGRTGLNTLRLCVGRLRAKLGDDARCPRMIVSVRGHGYRFVVPVVELSDEGWPSSRQAAEHTDYLDAVVEVAHLLAGCRDETDMANSLVEALSERGLADGAGVHHVEGDLLKLVAQNGLSDEWVSRMQPGIRLHDSYASVHAVRTAAPVQLMKVTARPHRGTYSVLRGERPHSCLFMPIERNGRVEGCLGLLRRTETPHGPGAVAVLRALCAVYAAEINARRGGVGPPAGATAPYARQPPP